MKQTLLLLTLVGILSINVQAANEQANIHLYVTGANPGTGQLLAGLYDSSENYMQQAVTDLVGSINSAGEVSLDFGEHPPGNYAFAVVYDENNNGKLDTGLFRIPKEKFGFSNNAKAMFGPARWNDAQFTHGAADIVIEIMLKDAD